MITKLDNGRIVLIHGDCLGWLPKIKQAVKLVVADPPYYKVTKEKWDHQWDTPEDYIEWLVSCLNYCHKQMTNDASLYLWQGIGHKSQVLFTIAERLSNSWCFQDWITWQKSRGLGNRKGWLYTREECLWFTKTEDYIWNKAAQYDLTKPTNRNDMGFNGKPRKSKYKRYTNVWECNEDQNYGADRVTEHYTPKPLVLIARIVNAHTLCQNDLVVDPFMGSGTTGVACVNLNRCFVGIEKDEDSYKASVDRISAALAKRSTLSFMGFLEKLS